MDTNILTYLMDQAAGVLIAVILIMRVETRLDQLVKSFEEFTRQMVAAMAKLSSDQQKPPQT